eukprot:GHVS01028111.1.p1 GENE.GHVS01028111.1~~GHVS01028111.1.p1  ORF type:complete len:704 (+),score=57.02 GHVS01028111.1:170-2281(+)
MSQVMWPCFVEPSFEGLSTTGASDDIMTVLKEESRHVPKARVCNFFEVDGDCIHKCLSNATVTFKGSGFSIKGTPTEWLQDERGIDCGELHFLGCNVTHFRQPHPRIFQWIDNKGGGCLHEHGLVFSDVEAAFKFCRSTRETRSRSMPVIRESTGNLNKYDMSTKSWTCIQRDIKFQIMQRKLDYLSYIEIVNGLGTILADVEISKDEYIFLERAKCRVTWWGPDVTSKEGLCSWFSVDFNARGGELHYTYAALETCLREHSAGRRVETDACLRYKDEAFDRSLHSSSSACVAADEWETVPAKEESLLPTGLRADSLSSAQCAIPGMMALGSELVYSVPGMVCRVAGEHAESVDGLSVGKLDDMGGVRSLSQISSKCFEYEGQAISPRQIMLHNCEQQMLFLGKDNDAYLMDIGKETVVQKMSAGACRIQRMFPAFRGALSSGEVTFLCHSATSLCLMDPRCPSEHNRFGSNSGKICRSYLDNVQLTGGATDGEGNVVLCSKLGYYRLYNHRDIDSFGRCTPEKNCFKGMGDPLVYVDVNRSGSWVLGTHSKFLTLTPTMLADGQGSAFVKDIGTTRGRPTTLNLSKADMIKHDVGACGFTKAVFDEDETCIITSMGNLVIVWDLRAALKNCSGEGAYTIYPMDDVVKDVGVLATANTRVAVSALPLRVAGTVVQQCNSCAGTVDDLSSQSYMHNRNIRSSRG